MIEVRAAVPAARAHLVRRPARPAPLRRARPRAARRAGRRRPRLGRAASRLLRGRGRQGEGRRRRRAVLHLRHDRQSEGRRPHPRDADRPRRRRRPLRQAHRRRRGARLPAAGLGRPEHLLLRAVAGLRLRRQLPGVGEHGDDRPEGDRPDLLLRAAARLRGPAHQRDDPHGRRRPAEALAVRPGDGAGAPGRPGADGRQAGRRARPAALRARQGPDLRAAAQHAGLFAGARRLHRRRGDRPRPLHLLPLDRHQPEAALRLDRDRGVRLPAARQRGARRHRRRADRRRRDQGRPTAARS